MNAHTVEVAGRKVGLVERGDGAPLVYLHGFADLHAVRAEPFPFHEALARTRRLIAPAHPGCADSDEYPDLMTVEDAVFHYLDLFDALGLDRFDLVGHCVGGWIAAEIAVRHPERITSLTLIGAAGLFVPGAPIGDVFMMAQPARGVDYADLRAMLFSSADAPLALDLFPNGRGAIDDEVRRYQMLRFGSFIGFKPPYFYHRALINRLHRIACPALVIAGERDRMVPQAIAKAYADGIKGARGPVVIPGAGHAAHLEAPDVTAKLVTDLWVSPNA
jgi:pimeloyl-ACP methyl ester carboxylesterase